MLEHWINPKYAKKFTNNIIAKRGSCFVSPESQGSMENRHPIALIGYGKDINLIRSKFYQLNFSSWDRIEVSDLGDIRNNDSNLMTPAYQELINRGLFPIILDPDINSSISLANAIKGLNHNNIQGIVSSSTNNLSHGYKLLSNLLLERKVDRLSILGYQKHLANPANQNIPNLDLSGLLSLGKLRDNLSDAEPILRELSTLYFDASTIKASDAHGFMLSKSIGLTPEEACKILTYASSSLRLKSLHISGFELENNSEMAAELVACLLWYAIEGRQNAEANPESFNEMNKYIVELSEINEKLKFWKKDNSERWWVEIPNEKFQNKLVPCSEKEYILACQNTISDRLYHLLSSR